MFGLGKKKRTPSQQLEEMSPFFVGCASNRAIIDDKANQIVNMFNIEYKIAYDFVLLLEVYGLVYAWVVALKARAASSFDVTAYIADTYPTAAREYSSGCSEDIEQSILFLSDALSLADRTIRSPVVSADDIDDDTYTHTACTRGLEAGRVKELFTEYVRDTLNDNDRAINLLNGTMAQYIDHAKSMLAGVKIV